MQSHTSHSHITFRLAGMDTWAPAGRYKVDLQEERPDTLTVDARRQTALTLRAEVNLGKEMEIGNGEPGIQNRPIERQTH